MLKKVDLGPIPLPDVEKPPPTSDILRQVCSGRASSPIATGTGTGTGVVGGPQAPYQSTYQGLKPHTSPIPYQGLKPHTRPQMCRGRASRPIPVSTTGLLPGLSFNTSVRFGKLSGSNLYEFVRDRWW